MKHIAWDESIIAEIFGGYGTQKNTRTLCGKRVNVEDVTTYDKCTCMACKTIVDETLAIQAEIETLAEERLLKAIFDD